MTKIKRTYTSICTSCGGTGIIRGIDLYITQTNICPACNGSKTILVTEEYDALYEVKTEALPINYDLIKEIKEYEKHIRRVVPMKLDEQTLDIKKLKELRIEVFELSIRQLSKLSGVSISTISRMESGKDCMYSQYIKVKDTLWKLWKEQDQIESPQ